MDSATIVAHIKDYCEGRLSSEQQQAFEAKLAANPEWQTAYESYLASQKVIDQLALKELKGTLAEAIKEKPTARKITLQQNWFKIAAAILLLLVAGTFLFQQFSNTNQQVAENAYVNPVEIFPELSAVRNADNTAEKWQSILVDFQNGQYAKIIAELPNDTELHPAQPLLLANAYFKNKQFKEALQILEDYQPSQKSFQEAADWLKILALVGEGNMEKAKQEIDLIINKVPTHIFKQQAMELLKKI